VAHFGFGRSARKNKKLRNKFECSLFAFTCELSGQLFLYSGWPINSNVSICCVGESRNLKSQKALSGGAECAAEICAGSGITLLTKVGVHALAVKIIPFVWFTDANSNYLGFSPESM
jgi:hypothetical protein